MKPFPLSYLPYFLTLSFALALPGPAVNAQCSACKIPPGEIGHPLRGVVTRVLAEKKLVVIQHEEIPGFMAAMTMSFHVPDDVFAQLERGTPLVGTLLPRKDDGWHLTEVRILVPAGAPLTADIPCRVSLTKEPSAGFGGTLTFSPAKSGDWRVCIDQRTASVEAIAPGKQSLPAKAGDHATPEGFDKAPVFALAAGETYEIRLTKSPASQLDVLIQFLPN